MLESIAISNYRGIREGSVSGLGHINLIVGPQRSGKTTLLESAFLAKWYQSDKERRHLVQSLFASLRNDVEFPSPDVWYNLCTHEPIEIECKVSGATFKFSIPFSYSSEERSWNCDFFERMTFLDACHVNGSFAMECIREMGDKASDVVTALDSVHPNVVVGLVRQGSEDPRFLVQERPYSVKIGALGSGMLGTLVLLCAMSKSSDGALFVANFGSNIGADSLSRFASCFQSFAYGRNCQVFMETHNLELVQAFLDESRKWKDKSLKVIQTNLSSAGRLKTAVLSAEEANTLIKGGFDIRK